MLTENQISNTSQTNYEWKPSLTEMELQPTSYEIWQQKYQLKNEKQEPVDLTVSDTFKRVAKALSRSEPEWYERFLWALNMGATPAGRIMSNAGAEEHKPSVSTINCTVSQIVKDSMKGILEANLDAGLTLAAGCGIGYEFSTLRPRGAFVSGAGAYTSGSLSFMDIFDSMCFTVASAGGRRGAQMATFAVWHPDVEAFIVAKREDGRFRQFNCSLLIDDEFMEAVKNDSNWDLRFPVRPKELEKGIVKKNETVWKPIPWERAYCEEMDYILDGDMMLFKVYKTIKAKELWDTIMKSTYDFAEPGFLLIDRINEMNNNYFCEQIRATNPCGEQPLPPEGSCLLGSINLAKFVINPFSDHAEFDFDTYAEVVRVFSRMLDNVVELNGLPLEGQRREIENKRRHGMGFLGLGTTLSLLGMEYGSKESVEFTEDVAKTMAIEGYRAGIDLAEEKGPAPLLGDMDNRKAWIKSKFMKRIWKADPTLKERALEHGCRYTHATSIAPTGTISLSVNNNVSNGIEPSFSHKYTRNVIKEGKKSKEAVDVYSYEMLLWKHITGNDDVPEFFSTSDNIKPKAHVDIQAAAQKWCDSSISKTINVPTDTPFEEFKDIYTYAYSKGLKGCTTFRFNPAAFQGVLVTEDNLKKTIYRFTTDEGEVIEVAGNEKIMYDGEEHSAANLYDALKENYFGKF